MWCQSSVVEKLMQPPTAVIGKYTRHTRENCFPLHYIHLITHGRLCPSLKKKHLKKGACPEDGQNNVRDSKRCCENKLQVLAVLV